MDRPPWVLPFLLVFVVLPLAIGLWAALVPIYNARKLRAVENMRLPTDVCVACGASDVELIAPDVVRCRACGFVGGEGMAAWQLQLRSKKLAQLSPEQRRSLAIDNLREARQSLLSAEASLDDAATASVVDLAGLSFNRGEAKQSSWGAAVWQMRTAHQLATEAAQATRATLAVEAPRGIDESAALLSLDTAWLTDGLIVDVAVHLRIEKARKQAQEMRTSVETLLAQLTQPQA